MTWANLNAIAVVLALAAIACPAALAAQHSGVQDVRPIVVEVEDDSFDWRDAAVGAVAAIALSLVAGGIALALVHSSPAARDENRQPTREGRDHA